jgi:hypothetical protein
MGLAERELAAIDELIARKQAANPAIDYAVGWRLLMSERPDLMQSYSRATMARELTAIDKEMARRRAANPTLDYMAGWRLLASERADLITANNRAASLQPPQSRMSGGRRDGGASQTITMSAKPLARELAAIDEEIAARRVANPRLAYGDAWTLVARERPELIRAYNSAAARVFVGRA